MIFFLIFKISFSRAAEKKVVKITSELPQTEVGVLFLKKIIVSLFFSLFRFVSFLPHPAVQSAYSSWLCSEIIPGGGTVVLGIETGSPTCRVTLALCTIQICIDLFLSPYSWIFYSKA